MAYCNKRLILASGSPRRRELLDKFGIDYEILPAQGEESAPPEETQDGGDDTRQDVNVVMSNSLGFGGHNATLLIRKYED